jgi:hypothetical protein
MPAFGQGKFVRVYKKWKGKLDRCTRKSRNTSMVFKLEAMDVFFYTCHSFGEQKAPFTAGREINV